jgi:branched-chain amino acid transport system permease protein
MRKFVRSISEGWQLLARKSEDSDLELILQAIVNGILFGSMYGTAAIGLSLIFGTMRIVFLAQGSVIILFSYLCFWLFSLFGIDPYISFIPITILALLGGVMIYYFLFREAAALKDPISSLLIAVGLMLILDNFMTVVWSPNPRSVVTSYGFYVLKFFGIRVTLTRLIGLVIAIISMAGVNIFLKKTVIGTAVRACSEDSEASTLMGISPNKVNGVAFAIGIGLAGIAGINFAATYSFDPNYGFDVAIKALVSLILGGIGNVAGALLGGIIIGLIESVASFYIGMGWAQAVLFVIFLLTLTLRPYGLFGKNIERA